MFTEEEVRAAYQSLKNHFYYEKYDLSTRKKVFSWPSERISKFTQDLNDSKTYRKYLEQISLNFYPKSYEEREQKSKEDNYYSNHQLREPSLISNFMIFIDAPVEIHLISVLWIKLIGRNIDALLGDSCYGNRLLSLSNQTKRLFRKFHHDYKKWWKGALDVSKKSLQEKEDITIFTFDIKSFYHAIEYDFETIKFDELDWDLPRKMFLNKALRDIHYRYKDLLSEINHPDVSLDNEFVPLPIGLMSSFILANDYLREFDKEIKLTAPRYYGRYVDDIILVYGGLPRIDGENNQIERFIKIHFSDFFVVEEGLDSNIYVNIEKYSSLKLQKKKVFLYQLSCENSPSIIDVLIEEQRQRSSEYRFLSDINDTGFTDFESVIFENSFDFEEGNKAKFKEPNEDKFKMASFIAKLTQKIIEFGPTYKRSEVDKVHKFFKGKYYIRHHYFWEKILTLFWVSESYELFESAVDGIRKAIDQIVIQNRWNISELKVKEDLYFYLECSAKLAVNLNSTQFHSEFVDLSVCTREHFSRFQFLQYTKAYELKKINLLSVNSLEELKESPELLELKIEKIPTGKSFYWCYIYKFYYFVFSDLIAKIAQARLLTEALALYNQINLSSVKESEVWRIEKIEFISTINRDVYEVTIPSKNNKKEKYRSCLVNQYVDSKNFGNSLAGKPSFASYRAQCTRHILDEIGSIENLDLVVRPELSIPYPSLFQQVANSSRREYSLTSGIEFISSKTTAYNFIISTLPCRIDETFRDCVPIIRIKNQYSHREASAVMKKKLLVPKLAKKVFFLFRWSGLYFSNYYCFELTSIEDRSIFKSLVDVIIAPIWNQDGQYFRSISDSLVRDLHCYYLQSNTSQYADTRISQPSKTVLINQASVKGGTIPEDRHNFNLVIGELLVEKLRKFQTLEYDDTQEEQFKKKSIFKPLPPYWNYDNVRKRINNHSFSEKKSELDDDLPF